VRLHKFRVFRHQLFGSSAKNIRLIKFKGELRQEWRHSNSPGNDYFANVWLVGVRMQR